MHRKQHVRPAAFLHAFSTDARASCEAYVTSDSDYTRSFVRSVTKPAEKRAAAPRSDGRCGKDFDDATCDANGEYGGCCSQYG